ncbi:hypothetical protein LBMAG46_40020 [Planctomycetia bacterium]|nr:hypothetical protein LBMAG46_40020 [Planctomycetia bacterium]
MSSDHATGSAGVSGDWWPLHTVAVVCVSAVCVALLTFRLGDSLLWDVDECRNARCTAEMLERGDLVVPTFNGELRTHKPILLYWLTMSSVGVFGQTEFAMRLPSALCGLGTVCCVWFVGRMLFSRAVAWLAAFMLSSSLLFVMASRAATPDAPLIFCQTLGLTFFVRAFLPLFRQGVTVSVCGASDSVACTGHWLLMYLALGLAMLAKGPVGLVLPLIICGGWLLGCRLTALASTDAVRSGFAGRLWQLMSCFPMAFLRSALQLRPIRGGLLALLVAAPWYIVVGLRTDGAWLRGFFLEHNLSRAVSTMEGHSGSALLFYPLALCVGFFPWSVFLGPALLQMARELRDGSERSRALLFGLCWIGCPMLAFSIAATKLPSYITPGYPGIVLIVASYLDRVLRREVSVSFRWQQAAFVTAALVGVLLTGGLFFAADLFLPGQQWLAVIPVPLAVASVFVLRQVQSGQMVLAARCWGLSAAAFTLGIFSLGVPAASQQRQLPELLQFAAGEDWQPHFAAWGTARASWIYYADQQFSSFTPETAEAAADFLLSGSNACLLVAGSQLEQLRQSLPIAIEVRKTAGDFPDSPDDTLCVVSASSAVAAAEGSKKKPVPVRSVGVSK